MRGQDNRRFGDNPMKDPPPAGAPSRPSRGKRFALAAGAVLALLILGGVVWRLWPGRPAPAPQNGHERADAVDPRLTYPTPFQNVRPDVKYVGDEACAECHNDLFDSFRRHPMGRALAPVAAAEPIERYEAAAFNPFPADGLHYGVERRDGRVFHREWADGPDGQALVQTEAEVQFAVGSGARGRSYIIDRDGYLFQSPITWYPAGGRWDLAPSYETRNQHFSRPITPGCLFCHCNAADHVPDTVNRYRRPIFQGYAVGCERCHGPGEKHVRRPGKDPATGVDATIVNPKHLSRRLREAVCEQCHLQGEQRVVGRGRSDFDYRPGLPLDLFLMDFVGAGERPADFKFVSAVEQMAVSRCYTESREPKKLGCTSCHDPHRRPRPEEKITYYRERCLECHTEASCSLPLAERHEKSKEDSCIACHMPPTATEVNHAAATDHRVPRRAEGPAPARPTPRRTPGPSELVAFRRDLTELPDAEVSRNLGVALMHMLDRGPPPDFVRRYAETALPLLDGALRRDPHDSDALQARGDALWALGRREEALSSYDTILSETPESEAALSSAGKLALEMNRPDAAQAYFDRAVRVNPWNGRYHQELAVVFFRRGDWDRSADECGESLRLEPTSAAPRSLLVQCRLRLGRIDQAQAEYETLVRLTPENRRADLRLWYDEQRRRLAAENGAVERP